MSEHNTMRAPKIDKVTVHIGVGESGERLNNAEEILKTITSQQGVRTKAKRTLQAFGIKKGEPIGCKVTLRGEVAETFLRTSLSIMENKLKVSQFDQTGNFNFGIEEHTDFPGMKYDPNVGIFGMDVAVSLIRPGYRISRRKISEGRIPTRHRITPDDAIAFMKESYGAEVLT